MLAFPARRFRLTPSMLTALLAIASLPIAAAEAQQLVVQPGGGVAAMTPEQQAEIQRQMVQRKAAQAKQQESKKANKKNEQQKGGEDKAKKEDKPQDSDSDKSVTRPDEPPKVPDPRELEIEPIDGRITFGFNGQPWPDVLQWIANASKMSLDWQELPSGYLNLTTQRGYTLPEARDLINRHLQARGYVMLIDGEVMSIAKIDKIDPSLVPRVTEDQLYDLQPHSFVKLTFSIPAGIEVKEASEDVKQALSKHAKLLPLSATRRLLVIDSVLNLRLVSALLNEERLERDGREVPRRFPLRHARAEQVIDTLYVVLGVDPAAQQKPINPKQLQKHMQMVQKMQKQGKKAPKLPGSDTPKVHLAYNRHDNSILANAPPAQLKIISRTIKMLDIPPPGMGVDAASDPGARYAKTYELQSIEPDSLISSLEEIGNLSPLTDLRGDRKSKVLFARASEADHQRIEEIIKQLDGPKQRVAVFWLRRHPADAVAGTIASLIGGKKEKKKTSRYSFWDFRYGSDLDEEEEVDLRVDADIENNRLLVRGNDAQLAEVRQLLAQLGEIPGEGPVAEQGVRVLDAIGPAETSRLLEQLRRAWPAMGEGSELIIQDNRIDSANDPRDATERLAPENGRTTAVNRPRFHFAADTSAVGPGEVEGANAAAAPKPKVSITITEDGRMVINASDPRLLDRLDRMIGTLTPDEATFAEFKLEHRGALYVLGKLEDFYDEILNANSGEQIVDWNGRLRNTGPKDQGSRLSRRRKLRMVSNSYTNSIVVTNASPAQLREIERLIEIWDQPAFEKGVLQRRTGMVKVRYSRAVNIAAALKDVYRDLLSSRDKEFATEEDKGGSSFAWETLTRIEYSGAEPGGPGSRAPTQVTDTISTTFDGTLSIGVDELANMIVISADAELYDSVVDMIQQLDEEARPKTTVQVLRVGVQSDSLRSALEDALAKPWPGGRPEAAASSRRQNNQSRQQQGQQNRRQRRGRNR